MSAPVHRRSSIAGLRSMATAVAILAASRGAIASEDGAPTSVEPPVNPLHVWSNHRDWITSLSFLKDGRHLCVGTYEELQVRDARDVKSQKTIAVKPGYLKSLAVSLDGK